MLIYNKYSNFDLFRFKDFDSHNLSSPNDIQKHLLDFSFFSINIRDLRGNASKIEPNKYQFKKLFCELSNRHPYDFFNMLITIYPSIIFSTGMVEIDKWKILRNKFKNVNNEDIRLLNSVINFRLNISEIETELNMINNLDYAEIDKSLVYQNLFTTLYKYLFVLFSKSIEFPIPHQDQYHYGKSYSFDIKSLKKEIEKRLNAQYSSDLLKKHASNIYLENVCKSAKVQSIEDLNYLLSQVQPFCKVTSARQIIYDSFLKALKVDNKKTKFRASSILRNITKIVIVPLFQPVFGRFQDQENFIRLCDNLSRNKHK